MSRKAECSNPQATTPPAVQFDPAAVNARLAARAVEEEARRAAYKAACERGDLIEDATGHFVPKDAETAARLKAAGLHYTNGKTRPARTPRKAARAAGAANPPPEPPEAAKGPENGLPGPTNEQFLTTVFGGEPAVFVNGFPGDPEDGRWGGKRIALADLPDGLPETTDNTYFSTSSFPVDARARKLVNALRCRALVLDDPQGEMPLDPSYVLQTSQGSGQIGFLTDAPVDRVNRLLKGLAARKVIKVVDPSGNNAVRWVRLPEGVNAKAKYPEPFKHVMHDWHPERVYSIEQLEKAFGTTAAKPAKTKPEPDIDRTEDAELVRRLVSSDSYHGPMVQLSARYAGLGMSVDAICGLLEGLFANANRREEWAARVGDIRRTVESAVEKFGQPQVDREAIFKRLTDARAEEPEAEDLTEMLDAIPDDLPEHEVETLASIIATIASHRVRTVEEMTAQPTIEYYVEDLMLRRIAGSLVSTGGVGKTTLLILLGIETALGGSWLGRKVMQGSFVLLSLDDAQEDLDAALALVLKARKLDRPALEKVANHLKLISLRGVPGRVILAQTNAKGHVVPTALVDALLAPLQRLPDVRCVALDTLRQFAGGTTNDDAIATVATKAVTRLADELQCCAILPHHTTKEGARNGTADQHSGSGSGALGDNLRFALVLNRAEAKDVTERLKLNQYEAMALHGPKATVLRLIDTRGSVLRATVPDTFILRTEYRFMHLVGQPKTQTEREDELDKAILLAVKAGATSVDAVRKAIGKGKPLAQERVTSLRQRGLLTPGKGLALTDDGRARLA